MGYKSLNECISDLNSVNELKKIKEEINPELEMASIHLEEFTNDGKAILFENIKNCNYRAVSNIFGSSSRSRYIFRDSLKIVKDLIAIKTNPIGALKNFPSTIFAVLNGIYALPKKVRFQGFEEITINDLPDLKFLLLHHP